MTQRAFGKEFRKDFALESQYVPVNHGSFGVYPNAIKPLFREYQDKAEQHPDRWNRIQVKPVIQANLERLSKFVNCDASDISFVLNASNGVNTVLRSFPFKEGDKILCVSKKKYLGTFTT
jgi:selenocysteine lyase/cysteine desulfurase